MNEKEKDDEEADETVAVKEIEEISKEDVEIRRPIEEGRNTTKQEKQRLKEVRKRINMYQGQKECNDSKTSNEYSKTSKG